MSKPAHLFLPPQYTKVANLMPTQSAFLAAIMGVFNAPGWSSKTVQQKRDALADALKALPVLGGWIEDLATGVLQSMLDTLAAFGTPPVNQAAMLSWFESWWNDQFGWAILWEAE